MKKLILTLFLATTFLAASAQNSTAEGPDYKTAIGAKLWTGGGISVKTFINFDRYGTRITGLYEIHGNLSSEGALKWYVGPGAHVGLYKGITAVGIDGVVGIDYKFTNMPLNLALDWQPSFELGSGTRNGFNANWGGFAIRFTL